MSYRYEKESNGDIALVFEGFEKGIAPSPHAGIGSMTAVDIETEQGEAMCSYTRFQQNQNQSITNGNLAQLSTNTITYTSGGFPKPGTWIVVGGSTISGLSNGTYYVLTSFKLSTTYTTDTANAVTGMGSGTATWSSVAFQMGNPVQGATERYTDITAVTQYRYYVIDSNGRLWVKDTAITTVGGEAVNWLLPYNSSITSYNGSTPTTCTGMCVAFGFVHIFGNNKIFTIATSRLGTAPQAFSGGYMIGINANTDPHYALAGSQGRIYFTMGPYVGSIFPNTSIDPDVTVPISNIQSYCSYTTTSSTAGEINGVLNGVVPNDNGTLTRIPVFFFPGYGGTQPTNLTAGTRYYIECNNLGQFLVYAAQTGGSAIDITTGAVGQQYFNTYYPQSGDGNEVMTYSPQRLTLPASEISTTIAELGNTVIVGTQSNLLYPWNQVDAIPFDLIPMPEAGTTTMITVNNVVYVFAGNRGNIYITNASSVSRALKVPDYCSGLVQPYFVWGGAMFLRGRVWFSIQDQTSSHTGQCGGVWSFVPVQNFSYGEDNGSALRMDNKNSYNNFNGKTNVFIANRDQLAQGPQYWSAWISSSTSPTYGIDYSDTAPSTAAVIQTDLAATGTMLNKKTFKQIEYKLATLLDTHSSNETVTISYRTNLTDSFTSCGTVVQDATTSLSGYFVANFQNTQWLQLQVTLTPNGTATSSFVRLKEVRVR